MTTKKRTSGALTAVKIRTEYSNVDVQSETLPRRAAHFLFWAMENYPKQFVPWNWVLQAILGQKKTPRLEDKIVIGLRDSADRIRKILQVDYDTDLTSARGIGIRACTDSEDILKTQAVRGSRRVRSAVASLSNCVDLIDPHEIPDTPENQPWKIWFTKSLRNVVRDLKSPETDTKLLPPKKEEN